MNQVLKSTFHKTIQHLYQQSTLKKDSLFKTIKKINRKTKMDLRTKRKFNNLLQSPLYQEQNKAAQPAAGFFGALVGGFANVFAEDSSGDDLPPASPVAGPSVPAAKNAPYQKAELTNLAAAIRASFRNTRRQHRYLEDRKKTPSKKK